MEEINWNFISLDSKDLIPPRNECPDNDGTPYHIEQSHEKMFPCRVRETKVISQQ